MFARMLALLILAASASPAIACSCSDIDSIEETIASADAVILGRIGAHVEPNYGTCGERCIPQIEIDALDSLKGHIGGRIRIDTAMMCYQSFPDDLLRAGDVYVLPVSQSSYISRSAVSVPARQSGSSQDHVMSAFHLATCAHNALRVGRLGLYTSELAVGGGRDLRYFMPLFSLRLLLKVDLLNMWRTLAVGSTIVAIGAILGILVLRRRRRVGGV